MAAGIIRSYKDEARTDLTEAGDPADSDSRDDDTEEGEKSQHKG